MKIRSLWIIAVFTVSCVASGALIVSSATAHEGASGIVKQRMDAMKSMGDHAKMVGDMLKGKTTYDLNVIRTASEQFVRHGQAIPEQYPDTPESRQGRMTEALPGIWDDWIQFTALADKFTQDSRRLEAIVASVDPEGTLDKASTRSIRAAFFKAVKNCSECHERFRLDSD